MEIGQLEGFSGIRVYNSGLGASSYETAPVEKKVTWVVKADKGTELRIQIEGARIGRKEAKTVL